MYSLKYYLVTYREFLVFLIPLMWLFYWLVKRTVENQQHWQHSFDGLEFSAKDFYASVEEEITKHKIHGIEFSLVTYSEKGFLSDNREYLHIVKDEFVYDVCAAPFGNSFFVSMWYVEQHGFFHKLLLQIPIIKNFVGRKTYYQADTEAMSKSAIQLGFTKAIESMTQSKGIRALSDQERFMKF